MNDANTDRDEADAPRAFCPEGCYWECDHLVATGAVSAEGAALRPVEDHDRVTLMRCDDCGDYLYDVVAHARDHERLRQLGWLAASPPARQTPG